MVGIPVAVSQLNIPQATEKLTGMEDNWGHMNKNDSSFKMNSKNEMEILNLISESRVQNEKLED